MGYDYHLYKMKKVDAETISAMPYEEVEKTYGEDGWFYAGHLPMKQIHSNGELNRDEIERITEKGKRLLTHETFDKTEEEDILIIDKDGVAEWIQCYRERIITYLEKLVDGTSHSSDESKEDKRERYVASLLNQWKNYPPYMLNVESISRSNNYEHMIFELVYQYKLLKEDEVFIFCGH